MALITIAAVISYEIASVIDTTVKVEIVVIFTYGCVALTDPAEHFGCIFALAHLVVMEEIILLLYILSTMQSDDTSEWGYGLTLASQAAACGLASAQYGIIAPLIRQR